MLLDAINNRHRVVFVFILEFVVKVVVEVLVVEVFVVKSS